MKGQGVYRTYLNYKDQEIHRRIKNLTRFNAHYNKIDGAYKPTSEWAETLRNRRKKRGGGGGGKGNNHKIIVTLYKYETGGAGGKTLELDIVGKIILSDKHYKNMGMHDADTRDARMINMIVSNLGANDYVGLMTAASNAEDKYGFEEELTYEEQKDFEFIRFFINSNNYTDKVVTGVPNVKSEDEEED